jgi:hypothetical protein
MKSCLYALKRTIDVIARKWSLFVLNTIGNNTRLRFNEIMNRLPDVSPTTLTETLDKLAGRPSISQERKLCGDSSESRTFFDKRRDRSAKCYSAIIDLGRKKGSGQRYGSWLSSFSPRPCLSLSETNNIAE